MRLETPSAWSDSSPAARATAVARGLALYALLGGALSFLGWAADVPRLTDWEKTGVSIQPNTALAVVASSAALLLLSVGRRRAATLLGAVVALLGASTLFQWISGVNLGGLNTLFLFGREWGRIGVVEPGRMGPPASTCWSLIGVALVVASTTRTASAERAVRALAFGSLAISALSIVGFLYRAGPLYTLPYATVIAFQTATFIVAVSTGVLALLPERAPIRWLLDRGPTGTVARRIAAFILLVSPAVGWLALQGELWGLYGARFEIAALSLAFMTLSGAMLSWNLVTIERHDEALRRSERQMADTLESITDACVTFDRDWRYVVVNEKAAKLLGMDRS